MTWRTSSEEALQRRVLALEESGLAVGWTEGDQGMPRTFEYVTPGGHTSELVWEVNQYHAPLDLRSKIKTRHSKRPLQGLPPKRLDHINLLSPEVAPMRRHYEEDLGFITRERVVDDITPSDHEVEVGSWHSVNLLSHEVAITRDLPDQRGRLHHVAFYYGVQQHNSDMAEICRDYGIRIEAGPDVHGLSQGAFLYVFEPGGNRIELFGNSGILTLQPDAPTQTWYFSDFDTALAIGGSRVAEETMFVYGTPGELPPLPSGGQQTKQEETV